jgi:hypothetical protein
MVSHWHTARRRCDNGRVSLARRRFFATGAWSKIVDARVVGNLCEGGRLDLQVDALRNPYWIYRNPYPSD